MAKLDEIKEEIGAIKTYLGFIVAFIFAFLAKVMHKKIKLLKDIK